MTGADVLRPGRFDVAENSNDLFVAQHAFVDRHVGRIVRIIDQRANAVFGEPKQRVTIMVPGVSRFIMWRSRKPPIFVLSLPL